MGTDLLQSRVAHRPSRTTAVHRVAVVALAVVAAGCSHETTNDTVQRIVVCAGVDEGRSAGMRAQYTFLQGGKQVAAVDVPVGGLTAVLVPDLATAVLLDGEEVGVVGWDGRDPGPSAPSSEAPDDATIDEAAAADPAEVLGYTGITGPGCPGADALGGTH